MVGKCADFSTSTLPHCAASHSSIPKLWYALDDMGDAPEDANYDFLYLPHPRCVTAMSWRPKQKHEP